MSLLKYAKRELSLIEYNRKDEILERIKQFSKEGHSGCSATIAIGSMKGKTKFIKILKSLLSFRPLTPIEDVGWTKVGKNVYQHKRLSTVFKDNKHVYDIGRVVYIDMRTGDTYVKGTRVKIEFPYVQPPVIYVYE